MLSTDQKSDERRLSPTSLAFLSLRDDVMVTWEREVRLRVAGARDLLSPVLLNTLPAFYGNIAEALTTGYPRDNATSDNTASSAHGGERARMTTFGVDQVIQEYQIFTESIRAVAQGKLRLGLAEWSVIDRSINAAVVEAVRALMSSHDNFRNRVAASLSHDMRTPLSVIANGASVIELSQDPAASRRAAAMIKSNAHRLSRMVAEILGALTDNESFDLVLRLSRFDIQDLIKTVCSEFSDGGLGRFESEGDSVVGFWCKDAMRRALDNLASNARKYGDGGVVTISARMMGERILLTVHNCGEHIPEGRQTSIFEYLQRGANSASAEGWGIGLQYVKKVAEGHGGSVAVDSSEAAGTTFLVDLPVDSRPFVSAPGGSYPARAQMNV